MSIWKSVQTWIIDDFELGIDTIDYVLFVIYIYWYLLY
jgi:hypothetical protein